MDVRDGLLYTEDHEWLKVDGDTGTIGITAYAAEQLGDIVFVEVPAVGTHVEPAATFGVVESVKAVSDIFSPVAGEVIEANAALAGSPELVNTDPYGDGWILKVRLDAPPDASKLRDAAAYRELLESA